MDYPLTAFTEDLPAANRRQCVGELIEIDGSDHAWFEDSGLTCTLLPYIDNATSKLMQVILY